MARLAAALVLCALGLPPAAGAVAAPAPGPAVEAAACSAPEPVCAARRRVFPVASFDPVGSAVLLEPGLLVTSRHVVADRGWADVFLPDGGAVRAVVVPTAYPGDLVLLQAPVPLDAGAPIEVAPAAGEAGDGPLYAITARVAAAGWARVHAPGEVILPPEPGRRFARLHHSAVSEPGNGGGALVDASGRLVAVIASGGEEGRNEAVPAAELDVLRLLSGVGFMVESQRLGAAYRRCLEALERGRTGGSDLGAALAREIIDSCAATANRQLYDVAGRLLGLSGRIADAVAMFEAALDQDPGAVNAMVGRVIALNLGLRFAEAVPQARRLVELLPDDPEVLRLAAQAGAWGGAPALAARARSALGRRAGGARPDDAPPLPELLGAGIDPLLGPPRPKG